MHYINMYTCIQFKSTLLHLDINECLVIIPCAVNAECHDTEGSFECSCLPGYSGDGHASCTGVLRALFQLFCIQNEFQQCTF